MRPFDGDCNIGGGIGLNIVQNDNEAVIGRGPRSPLAI